MKVIASARWHVCPKKSNWAQPGTEHLHTLDQPAAYIVNGQSPGLPMSSDLLRALLESLLPLWPRRTPRGGWLLEHLISVPASRPAHTRDRGVLYRADSEARAKELKQLQGRLGLHQAETLAVALLLYKGMDPLMR